MIFAQNDEWSVFSQSLRLQIFSFVLFFQWIYVGQVHAITVTTAKK